MKRHLYFFLFLFLSLIGTLRAGELPTPEEIIREGAEKLRKQIEQNAYNNAHGLSSNNRYTIVVGDDDKIWKRLRVVRNSNIDPARKKDFISVEDQEILDKDLLAIGKKEGEDKQVVETYLIVINYLPALVDEELKSDGLTIEEVFSGKLSEKNATQRVDEEASRIFTGIFNEATKDKTNPIIVTCVANAYVFFQKEKISGYKTGRIWHDIKNVDPQISQLFSAHLDQAVKRGDFKAVNAVRAQSAVSVIKAAVDDFIKQKSNPECLETIDALVASTKAAKTAGFIKAVEEFAKLLNNPSSATLGSNYLIVDNPSNFSESDVFTRHIIPDKLNLLAQPENSNYKMYVAFKEVDFVMTEKEREDFARQVSAKFTKAQGANSLVVVIPYYPVQCMGRMLGFTSGVYKGLLMPGVYGGDARVVSQLKEAFNGLGTWEERFNKGFKGIPKKHVVYSYSFLWNGDFIKHGKTEKSNVTESENFVDLVISDDGRFEKLKEAKNYLIGLQATIEKSLDESNDEEFTVLFSQLENSGLNYYYRLVQNIMKDGSLTQVKINNDLKQSVLIKESNSDQAAKAFYADKKGDGKGVVSLAGDWFYSDINLERRKAILKVVDVASFAASFIGADVVFDGLGLWIAYSSNLSEEIPLYSAGLALGVVTGGELKALIKSADWAKALRKGELLLVKIAYNNKIVLNGLGSNRLYSSFFPIVTTLKLEKTLTSNLVSVIDSKEVFLRTLKYARKLEYRNSFNLLEKGFTENVAFREYVHSNPKAIDDFFEYLKKKPGTGVDEVFEGIRSFDAVWATLKQKIDDDKLFLLFKADFEKDALVLGKFEKGVLSVEAWKALNADDVIRKNVADLEKVSNYLKNNPTKFDEVREGFSKAADKRKWVDELGVPKSSGDLIEFANIRKYLGDGQIKAYLNNNELFRFEKALKTADKDVLTHIGGFKSIDDFAEMVRGFKDNPEAFENAVKDIASFADKERGWLRFWGLTPNMEQSLLTIRSLKSKLDMPTGNATDIQLASIHAFTVDGDFLNVPMRYNDTWFGVYNKRALKHINEGIDELKKAPGRKIVNERVYSGKAYSLEEYKKTFVGGNGKDVPFKGFVSTSKNQSVAEGFINENKKWAGEGDKVAVIRRIISKEGVYIDDISDWGKNLGPIKHSDKPAAIQIQEEVLMKEGYFKQTSEPIPIMENGVQKIEGGIPYYYVDFIELVKPLK